MRDFRKGEWILLPACKPMDSPNNFTSSHLAFNVFFVRRMKLGRRANFPQCSLLRAFGGGGVCFKVAKGVLDAGEVVLEDGWVPVDFFAVS